MNTPTEHIGVVTGLPDLANFLASAHCSGRRGDGDTMKALLFGRPKSLPPGLQREFLDVASRAFPAMEAMIVPPQRARKDRFHAAGYAPAGLAKSGRRRIVYGNAVHKPFHLSFYAYLGADEFIFFDNGLSSYWDQEIDMRAAFSALGVPFPALSCLSLNPPLPAPNYLEEIPQRPLSAGDFAECYAGFRAAGRAPKAGWLPENVILGTSIYRTNVLSWEEERGLYLRLIDAVRRRSSGKIVFKSHPRATERPLIFETDGVEVFESSVPVEAFVKPGSQGAAYGIASTSLITFQRLFGWKSYRIDAPETRRAVEKRPHRGLAASIEPIVID